MRIFVPLAIFIPISLTANISRLHAETSSHDERDSSASIGVTGKILVASSGFAPVASYSIVNFFSGRLTFLGKLPGNQAKWNVSATYSF